LNANAISSDRISEKNVKLLKALTIAMLYRHRTLVKRLERWKLQKKTE